MTEQVLSRWNFQMYIPEVTAATCLLRARIYKLNKCNGGCMPQNENYLAMESPGIGRSLLFICLHGVLYVSLLVLLEADSLWANCRANQERRKMINMLVTSPDDATRLRHEQGDEDDDVRAERERVMLIGYEPAVNHRAAHQSVSTKCDGLDSENAIVVKEVSKLYGGSHLAVDRVSFALKKGECFGLLGVNGAGKSTTFKMLTGEETMTTGNIYMLGRSVRQDWSSIRHRVGYCPQFDALICQMTVVETLWMYARLRQIEECCIERVVEQLMILVRIERHKRTQAGKLSGGNKRKLSTAVALIGDPPVVLLDEPTTGMDPVARRKLWNSLMMVRNTGRTLVLTSHSMEECEALCTKLAIMVDGRIKCLGSTQHLKVKFGKGYTVMVKLRDYGQGLGALGAGPGGEEEAGFVSPTNSSIEMSGDRERGRGMQSNEQEAKDKDKQITASEDPEFSLRMRTLALLSFFTLRFPNSQLKDHHAQLFHFHIPTDHGPTDSGPQDHAGPIEQASSPSGPARGSPDHADGPQDHAGSIDHSFGPQEPKVHMYGPMDDLRFATEHPVGSNKNKWDHPLGAEGAVGLSGGDGGVGVHDGGLGDLTWAAVFGELERAKERLHIEDYSVSQTSLEQVFLSFVRLQYSRTDDAALSTTTSKTKNKSNMAEGRGGVRGWGGLKAWWQRVKQRRATKSPENHSPT